MSVRRLLSAAILASIVIACTACVGAAPSDGSGTSADALTQKQIEQSGVTSNAYELIQNERPHWLQLRGGMSAVGDVVLYVDGIRRSARSAGSNQGQQGTRSVVRELRAIPVNNVARVRYLDPSDAVGRFGTGHQHGAILLRTKSGGG